MIRQQTARQYRPSTTQLTCRYSDLKCGKLPRDVGLHRGSLSTPLARSCNAARDRPTRNQMPENRGTRGAGGSLAEIMCSSLKISLHLTICIRRWRDFHKLFHRARLKLSQAPVRSLAELKGSPPCAFVRRPPAFRWLRLLSVPVGSSRTGPW